MPFAGGERPREPVTPYFCAERFLPTILSNERVRFTIDSAWLAMVLSFCFNPPRAVLNLSENMLTKIFPA